MLHFVGPQARLVQPSAAYIVMAYIVMADVGCCTGSAHKPGWYSLRRRVGTECEILFLYLAIPTAGIEADDGWWTARKKKNQTNQKAPPKNSKCIYIATKILIDSAVTHDTITKYKQS